MKRFVKWVVLFALFLFSLSLAACGEPAGILTEDLPNYVIVRPKDSGIRLKDQSHQLKKAFADSMGLALESKDDALKSDGSETSGEFEILVGETNRPESVQFLQTLRYRDYGYAVINGKIVIAGHSEASTMSAVQKFLDEVVNRPAEKVFLKEGSAIVKGEYPTDDMQVYGLSAKNLTVVYSDTSKDGVAFAEQVTEALCESSGYRVRMCSVKETLPSDRDLLFLGDAPASAGIPSVPKDLEAEEAFYFARQHSVFIGGGRVGYEKALHLLLSDALRGDGQSLPIPANGRLDMSSEVIRTMSFNVLVSKREQKRTQAVVEMISTFLPDTVGIQEGDEKWMSDFSKHLPQYAAVGIPRGDGSTEGTYMLYLKDKFTLVDSGTYWLSDKPQIASKYEESKCYRTYTYIILRRNTDGATFVHVNVHLDHGNETARVKQGKVLLQELVKFEDYPVVITGDFNAPNTSEVWKGLQAEGYLDASTVAQVAKKDITFHNYGSANSTIDFCFANSKVNVMYYKVCTEKMNGMFASDHHPLYIDFDLK